MRIFLFSLFIISACSVPDKTSLQILNETRKFRKSPVILKANKFGKGTFDQILLRKNNSFEYQRRIPHSGKSVFYVGTYEKKGDSLIFLFYKNHKDSSLTGKAFIDTIKKEIILISTNATLNKNIPITKIK
jgi:hypothetical protein